MGISYQWLRAADLAELIAAAQAEPDDDSTPMNEIIRRFQGKARKIAAAVCFRPDDHDDAANAACLALVRAVRRYGGEGSFPAYAAIFMVGAAREESARLARPQEVALSAPDIVYVAERILPALRPVMDEPGGEHAWGTGRIAEIIESLPGPQQALLTDRYVLDHDLPRIARRHGSSVSAVSQRLKTAHNHVRALLPLPTLAMVAA